MAATWSAITLEQISMPDTDTPISSLFRSMLPGESHCVELFRNDTTSIDESWVVSVIPSIDGVVESDISGQKRLFSFGFLRPIFIIDSIGTPYYRLTIDCGLNVSTNIVRALIRTSKDGVNFP